MIIRMDKDDDYIGDHADTVIIDNGVEVEEFETEIIYDESGIQVGETSTRLPIITLNDDLCAMRDQENDHD